MFSLQRTKRALRVVELTLALRGIRLGSSGAFGGRVSLAVGGDERVLKPADLLSGGGGFSCGGLRFLGCSGERVLAVVDRGLELFSLLLVVLLRLLLRGRLVVVPGLPRGAPLVP